MDRRNVQVVPQNDSFQKNCIHTKNVFSLLDLSTDDEAYKKITKHNENCKICSSELKKFELQNLAARIHIPKPQIDTETKSIFEREVSELFKAFDLNEKEALRLKIKKNIKNLDQVGSGLIKNMASKSMVKTYAFGLMLFAVLREFFN